MFGIGTHELILLVIVGIFVITVGVAALVAVAMALRFGKKSNDDRDR